MAYRKHYTLLTLTLLLTLHMRFHLAIQSPLCPAVCYCENFENENVLKLDCSRAYLRIIPPVEDWPIDITHMDLSSNNISDLDTELSQTSLQVLDLSHNRIESVIESAFGGLRSLKYLNLAGNGIESFEENGFYGLEHLKSLNISGNRLKILPDKLFYNFIGLQELSLSDNPLVHIDPIHFNRMINLRWLDLSGTSVYTLPANIFHTTGQLQFLDLSSNDFHQVPTDALRSAMALQHLKLSENPIDILDKTSFIKLRTLEVLELNYMESLTEVKDQTFSDLTSLRTLQLRYCHHLAKIHPLALDGLFNDTRPVLQELDLEGNQLRKMHKDVVPCARIRKFNLQKNPWVCDCNLKWIKECNIQKVYAVDLKCRDPKKVENALIIDINDDDFTCGPSLKTLHSSQEAHHEHVIRSLALGMAAGFLVIIAIGLGVLFKWRDIKTWYKNSRRGPGAVYYVRARAQPREI